MEFALALIALGIMMIAASPLALWVEKKFGGDWF